MLDLWSFNGFDTHDYLLLSSIKVMKYLAPPMDLILKGPHMSMYTRSMVPSVLYSFILGNFFPWSFPSKAYFIGEMNSKKCGYV
jgi:hypothetical protein